VSYRLAALLAVRGREEARARTVLARALGEEKRREDERATAAARAASHLARLEELARAPAPSDPLAGGVLARARFAARLRSEAAVLVANVAAACAAHEAARRVVDERRAGLAEARRRVRTLERHRETWEAQRALGRRRREEAEGDDRVSARQVPP
jgi:predicted ATP-grasp superfamily ATP-dependent carboligase